MQRSHTICFYYPTCYVLRTGKILHTYTSPVFFLLTGPLRSGMDETMQPSADIPSGQAQAPPVERLKGVTVVIPAFNEELVIGSVVLKTCRVVQKVIVVDDGSKDRTAEVARYAGAEVIRLDTNHGKAHALLLGLRRARDLGCIAAIAIDGDGQHKTHDIPRVIQPVLDGKVDLVIGSRFLAKKNLARYILVMQNMFLK